MKKSLFAMLLAVALVVPVFATDKGKSEIDVKLGLNVMPSITAKAGDVDADLDASLVVDGNMQFVLGAEYYYYVMKDLGIGLGVNRAFPTGYLNEIIARVDSTNIFATAKKRFETEGFFDAIYFLGRLGFGINNVKSDIVSCIKTLADADIDLDLDNGLYWGLGFGVEKNAFMVEVVYSVNYSKLKCDSEGDSLSADTSISALTINVGYKFAL